MQDSGAQLDTSCADAHSLFSLHLFSLRSPSSVGLVVPGSRVSPCVHTPVAGKDRNLNLHPPKGSKIMR